MGFKSIKILQQNDDIGIMRAVLIVEGDGLKDSL